MNHSINYSEVEITGGFWAKIQKQNAEVAIFHQWDQLEKTGSIENFRIAAGKSDHFRTGFFFSDSDVFKWLDAACRISVHHPSPALEAKIDELAQLVREAQEPDGYLYTYNQIHFPGKRWIALQIEHELYCHGHLIEACLAHDTAFPNRSLLPVAIQSADLICEKFLNQPAHLQPGHQEIELALLYLYERSGCKTYFEMANQFLERRGRARLRGWRLLGATLHSGLQGSAVAKQEKAHHKAHPEVKPFTLPPMNEAPASVPIQLRFLGGTLSGKYFQTHQPISQQNEAVGHSVRFGYTMAAESRRLRMSGAAPQDFAAQEALWREMVTKKMYVTGGLGSLPVIEGFGRDYELDPQLAYAETCATIASLLWDWELLKATGKAQYADLFEWQLYNAALVGLGQDGQCYLYNNPLAADGNLTREPWFRIPCCPSNISRIFAALGGYLTTYTEDTLSLQLYISHRLPADTAAPMQIAMESGLPFSPRVNLTVLASRPEAKLSLRLPRWAESVQILLNDQPIAPHAETPQDVATAGGYSPFGGQYLTLAGPFQAGDHLDIRFQIKCKTLQADPRVGLGSRDTALAYGPLVYCAEDLDNPGIDLDQVQLDLASFTPQAAPDLPGVTTLAGQDVQGRPIRLIPYYAWANRGRSKMRVFFEVQ